ncbi:ABC transporter permease [Brachybacterium sp. NBEC-018]|uniref:ABC transporter permease n=1 Tax=Brachybacterium sp. NBEC-018 TaxID=2996004 RepID=UPI002174DBFC|nr:ABC transporter permease [Brachybacterium sp. NBEC-018]UVY85068.1 ABC transporter permease [Brachybacterium sp. NBEC-018]
MANEVKSVSDLRHALESRELDASELSVIGTRPPLRLYIEQLWSRRHFIWFDSQRRAATQNSRNRLGNVWLMLRPMVDAAMYYVIFGLLLGVNRGLPNFPAFLLIGVLMFRSTNGAISAGVGSMRASKAMLRAFSFPRAAVPISNVLQSALTAVFTMLAMCIAIIIVPPHALPQVTWALIIPIFLLQTLLNLGVTFITARIGFHFPDLSNMMNMVTRFLMYGSGVIFPITQFIDNPIIGAIVTFNPLYQIIDMARVALIDGSVPALSSWVVVTAWAVLLPLVGFLFFWRGEESYGRELR